MCVCVCVCVHLKIKHAALGTNLSYLGYLSFFFRSIGCVKSFVPLGSQNGLSGVDHLQSPQSLASIVVLTGQMCCLSLCCRVDMTAGSDLVFDHLSHNHIEPRAEYQFVLDVLLVHSDLSLNERLLFARGE